MKKITRRLSAVFMALVMILSMAVCVNATDFKASKTKKFIDDFQKSQSLVVSAKNIEQDISVGKIKATDIKAYAKFKGDDIDIKANAKVNIKLASLPAINAKVDLNGKNIDIYTAIFRIDGDQILSTLSSKLGMNMDILDSIDTKEIAKELGKVTDFMNEDVLAAIVVEKSSDTYEKLVVSPTIYLAGLIGDNKDALNVALTTINKDYSILDKSDAEIAALLKQLAADGTLYKVLKIMGSDVTEEQVQMMATYANASIEVYFKGNDITNIKITDTEGNVQTLADIIPIGINYISANEEYKSAAPGFAINITPLVKALINPILNIVKKIAG